MSGLAELVVALQSVYSLVFSGCDGALETMPATQDLFPLFPFYICGTLISQIIKS